ncbi:hypothetical protein MGN01_13510 [Methylobacterium gnaphalii]|uniref:Uncharacterized protein n=1 Tax=Methylobacterium gnaphalii TaxID=1010610 RepID=A0A512JHU6_9HYPH|nr:hypothetical protein MGN01_13510 [Methylobacterium gnaphalii]GLS51720.1 hypothetical protein GCM10007885_45810 [Methylobacterium gnaphalii]
MRVHRDAGDEAVRAEARRQHVAFLDLGSRPRRFEFSCHFGVLHIEPVREGPSTRAYCAPV